MPHTVPNRPMYGWSNQRWPGTASSARVFFFLARDGHTHGTANTFHDSVRVDTRLLAQARELLETGTEHLLHAGVRVWVAACLAVQLGQVDA